MFKDGHYSKTSSCILSRQKLKSSQYIKRRIRKLSWTPPINFSTLEELSIQYIFKSIQLRHDLLFDPNLNFRPKSGNENKSGRYWHRVDQAFEVDPSYEFLRVIIREICRILVSLIQPFHHHPLISVYHKPIPWFWPTHITEADIYEALDVDLIIQQLKHNGTIGNQVEWLKNVFEAVLKKGVPSVDLMVHYFQQGQYAKALKQCFTILEAIKLNCANVILVHYRDFLINTCAEFEYQCFLKRPVPLDSVKTWLSTSRQRFGSHLSPKDLYCTALVHLVADDESIMTALNLKTFEWPMTLQFDQQRLTRQIRYEFFDLVHLSIMIVALCAKRQEHAIEQVKKTYLNNKEALVLDASVEAWVGQHLQPTSSIYQLMHERVCHHLAHMIQHGKMDKSTIEISHLENEIKSVSKKLKRIADLNLETYGSIYNKIF